MRNASHSRYATQNNLSSTGQNQGERVTYPGGVPGQRGHLLVACAYRGGRRSDEGNSSEPRLPIGELENHAGVTVAPDIGNYLAQLSGGGGTIGDVVSRRQL